MTTKNFTSIDDIVTRHKTSSNAQVGHPKEAEPVITTPKSHELHRVVEHEIKDEEVKPYVQSKHEEIKLTEEIKAIGAASQGHPKFTAYDQVKLPISDEKVVSGLRQSPATSLRWLAEFSQYLLKMMHLQLKVVNGKITREFVR